MHLIVFLKRLNFLIQISQLIFYAVFWILNYFKLPESLIIKFYYNKKIRFNQIILKNCLSLRTAVIERRKLCIESYNMTYFTFSMIIFLTMDLYQKIFICLIKKMKMKSLNFLKEVMMMRIPMRKKIKSRMQKIQTKNRKPVSTIGWNLLQSLFYIPQKSSSRST